MEYWWLIMISVITGVAGQTLLKLGVSQPGNENTTLNLVSLITMISKSPLVLSGLILYALGAVAWIAVLSRIDLSYADPFIAINFVLITLVSRLFLGEAVPTARWFGVAIICLGILVVARSTA